MEATVTRGIICGDIFWDIDPTGKFSHAKTDDILEACGIIPTFFDRSMDDVVQDSIERYGYSFGGTMDTNIDENGVYRYPGDPDLYPYMSTTIKGITIYIYAYGIVGYRFQDGTAKWVRMD
jgi:hypothetical protein